VLFPLSGSWRACEAASLICYSVRYIVWHGKIIYHHSFFFILLAIN
jgi:hypothetical protein